MPAIEPRSIPPSIPKIESKMPPPSSEDVSVEVPVDGVVVSVEGVVVSSVLVPPLLTTVCTVFG